MANIPIPTGLPRRPVKREALQSPALLTAGRGAQADFFSALTSTGLSLYRDIKEKERGQQLGLAKAAELRSDAAYNQSLRDDPSLVDSELIEFNKERAELKQVTDGILANKDAKADYDEWSALRRPGVADDAMAYAHATAKAIGSANTIGEHSRLLQIPVDEVSMSGDKFEEHLDDIAENVNTGRGSFSVSQLAAGFDKELIREGQKEQIKDRITSRLVALSDEEFEKQIKEMPARLKEFQKQYNVDVSDDWFAVKRVAKSRRDFDKGEMQAAKTVQLESLWDSAVKKPLPPDEAARLIDTMEHLSPTEKATQLRNYISITGLIKSGKGNPYIQRQDEKAYADMVIRLTTAPEKVTLPDLQKGVGKLWTTIDYLFMKKMLPSSDEFEVTLSSPVAKVYFDALRGSYDEKMTDEQRVDYAGKYQELGQIIMDNKGEAAKIEKEFQILTKSAKDDTTKELLSRIWGAYKWLVPYEMGKLLIKGGEEKEEPVELVDRLWPELKSDKKQVILSALEDKDKKSKILKALSNGYTIEEILAVLEGE